MYITAGYYRCIHSYIMCKYIMYHVTNTITKLAKWLYVDNLRGTQHHDIDTNPFSYDEIFSFNAT